MKKCFNATPPNFKPVEFDGFKKCRVSVSLAQTTGTVVLL